MSSAAASTEPVTLRARYVFPVDAAPIAHGTITLCGERIVAVGRRAASGRIQDLGNVALLPGLVNAHTHLELSDLPAPLGRPGMGFVDWLGAVMAWRRSRPAGTARAVERGIAESIRAGTAALGEIAQSDWEPGPFERAGLDARVFLELIAPTADRVGPALESAWQHVARADPQAAWQPGLAPHAPYSVHPELLERLAARLSAERMPAPLALHLAESREEIELLRFGTGPLREFLQRIPGWRPEIISRGTRPLDYLRLLATVERSLVIHGNYLDDEEIALVAGQRQRMAVVYCPRTHAFFGHAPYPLEKMLSAGAVVALGTDSRASSPDLSMLAEMRFAARRHPSVPRSAILRAATCDAAQALGLGHALGSLTPGKVAHLTVVRLPDREASDPHELLLESDEPVVATWIKGGMGGGGRGTGDER